MRKRANCTHAVQTQVRIIEKIMFLKRLQSSFSPLKFRDKHTLFDYENNEHDILATSFCAIGCTQSIKLNNII